MTWHLNYSADEDLGLIQFHPEDGSRPHSSAGIEIQFQHGPIGENGINGVQNEEVIDLLIKRIGALDERFPCNENKIAMAYLDDAVRTLRERTAKRQAQGVEGKNEPHVS